MKQEDKKQQAQKPKQDSAKGRTDLPGQNPRANDDPSHDEHNDENRRP